uniref:Nicotinamide-nucleotide adenylyltransferase n=2 Tax=Mesocestoides corti TaxID=53468 RepID=A0A5K3FAX8_MESCO
MNERRQDVRQPSYSNSNLSASSSLTSVDTVVFAAAAAAVPSASRRDQRARSLPSSTSTTASSSTYTTSSSSSSLNGYSTSSSSSCSSTYSSTQGTSTSSYTTYSSSPSGIVSTNHSAGMLEREAGRGKRTRDPEPAEGAPSSIPCEAILSPPKIERGEENEKATQVTDLCDCCCWQSAVPEPVVLVACGSFNPITTMHLRMMELARDAVEKTWLFHQEEQDGCQSSKLRPKPSRQVVVAGLYSPVSDAYSKAGLASAGSRCRLARLACSTTSDWLAVDSWEASRPDWTPTRRVLERIQTRLQRISRSLSVDEASGEGIPIVEPEALAEIEDPRFGDVSGSRDEDACRGSATNAWLASHLQAATRVDSMVSGRCCCGRERQGKSDGPTALPKIRIKFVCGADLLQSFATPKLWSEDDMTALVRDFGIICISRPESNSSRLLFELDILSRYEQNVILVTEWCQNGLSATLVRRALSRGQSVRYLVPDAVLEEIYSRGLYGAARPPRPRFASSSGPPPKVEVQNAKEKSDEESECPEDPSSCFSGDGIVSAPEAPIQLSETGTDPLHVQTRSHSVQTRLSSLPSPHSGAASQASTATSTGPVILHQVLIDPSVEAQCEKEEDSGLTAILPLLKQCTRCGSQRVRLLLVEKPPLMVPPQSALSAVHTPRHHHQCRTESLLQPMISPRAAQSSRKPNDHHNHHRHHRHQSTLRSQTQPIKSSGNWTHQLAGDRPRISPASTIKLSEKTSLQRHRPPCIHHQRRVPEAPSKGRSSARDAPSRDLHRHRHNTVAKSLPYVPTRIPPPPNALLENPVSAEPFQPTSRSHDIRSTAHDSRRPGPREPRLEGDGSATPSTAVSSVPTSLPRKATSRTHRQLLTPPAVEAQPAPPVAPRSRRNPPMARTTTSLSQPSLPQRGGHRRSYDEVDFLLYNLCLNIESAL